MKYHVHTIAVVCQFVAVAFLIIASITEPASTGLSLGHRGPYTFGVMGYCKGENDCSASLGYDLKGLLDGAKSVLSKDSLNSLTKVLIVAPIAGFLTLISLVLNIASHFSPKMAYSTSFWIVMIVLSFLCFVGSTLMCIISFLLFFPRVDWPTWCLIPCAVLNLVATVFFVFAWRLLPAYGDRSADDILLSEKGFNYDDNSSYRDETSLSFNPPPIRTQLHVDNMVSDEESNAKKSDVLVNSNELSEESTAQSFGKQALNSGTSSTEPFTTANANLDSKSTSSDLKLPSVSNPYLDSTNSHTVDSRLTTNDSLIDGHIRSDSSNSSDSNFTSISQRGVNPRYYAGAPNKPNMQMMNSQNIPPPQQRPHPNGPPMQQHGYYQMPNQPYNKGAYMQKPKPYMAMNGNRPPPGGGMLPPQNPYGYYGGQPPRGQPQMNGYQNPAGYKNRQRPNLPSASQTREGQYAMY